MYLYQWCMLTAVTVRVKKMRTNLGALGVFSLRKENNIGRIRCVLIRHPNSSRGDFKLSGRWVYDQLTIPSTQPGEPAEVLDIILTAAAGKYHPVHQIEACSIRCKIK